MREVNKLVEASLELLTLRNRGDFWYIPSCSDAFVVQWIEQDSSKVLM